VPRDTHHAIRELLAAFPARQTDDALDGPNELGDRELKAIARERDLKCGERNG
jgi:hypothetical protein